MRKILQVGAATAAVMVLAACGAGQASAGRTLPGTREFGLNDREFVEHVEKVQALIAGCMNRAGFEYLPVDVATVEKAQASVRKDPGVSRRDYKIRWGLSITTRFDDPVHTIGLGPNKAIIDGLAPGDRVAYDLTLLGEQRDSDFAWTFDEEDFSRTGGCTREAVSQVFTPDQLTGTYTNPKDVLVAEDPRVKEANRNWEQCMRDRGYDYKVDQDSIIEDYETRLDALLNGDDPQTLTGDRLDQLHALQQSEIKVSLADLDCQEKYTDEVFQTVETEVFGHPVSG